MYDVIYEIIGNSNVNPDVIFNISGALIIVLVCVFIDLIYRLFRHFWR